MSLPLNQLDFELTHETPTTFERTLGWHHWQILPQLAANKVIWNNCQSCNLSDFFTDSTKARKFKVERLSPGSTCQAFVHELQEGKWYVSFRAVVAIMESEQASVLRKSVEGRCSVKGSMWESGLKWWECMKVAGVLNAIGEKNWNKADT